MFLEAVLFHAKDWYTGWQYYGSAESSSLASSSFFRSTARHILNELVTGHTQTTSLWRKECCQKKTGEVRNRRKFLIADSGQTWSRRTNLRIHLWALIRTPSPNKPTVDTNISSACCYSCSNFPHFTAWAHTQPSRQHSFQYPLGSNGKHSPSDLTPEHNRRAEHTHTHGLQLKNWRCQAKET